ncbi:MULTISPECIES: hypothetical protein [unclassified Francisella]|uniref:hypothetical protein n=1 Tax=unclassified Francisella TaxID=2610885 RepID=UPI002E3105E1|nr:MULTISPECIES: hypothetical protein [unclassified Francisella]MED7819990.1 hypothetical protein [Francisella sp. 19S2-4]MED7830825.1 hypothetical protein [Francisella sp. 19S2-10]
MKRLFQKILIITMITMLYACDSAGYQLSASEDYSANTTSFVDDYHHHHHKHKGKWECINVGTEKKCGYHCATDGGLTGACAPKKNMQCIAKFGVGATCGYGCVSNGFEVKCASYKKDSCHVDNYNNIVCGRHCTKDNFGNYNCQE